MAGSGARARRKAKQRRWARQHQGKRCYESLERAEFDRGWLERRTGKVYDVYECTFGESPGAVVQPHWHVGGLHHRRTESQGYAAEGLYDRAVIEISAEDAQRLRSLPIGDEAA